MAQLDWPPPLTKQAITGGPNWFTDNLEEFYDLDNFFRRLFQHYDAPGNVPRYDYYQYDALLAQVGTALDRCLAYRKEIQDLTAAAAKEKLDFGLFTRQADTLEALDTAAWNESRYEAEAGAHNTASQAFAGVNEPLAKGFAAAEGAFKAVSDALAKKDKDERQSAVANHWREIRSYQKNLHERYEVQGHPLNFNDRAGRILGLLEQDLREVIPKAITASVGLEKVHGIHYNHDWVGDKKPLDRLVIWTRTCIQELNKRTHFDYETFAFSDEIPLDAIVKPDIRLPLHSHFPPGEPFFDHHNMYALRVRGVGCRIVKTEDRQLDKDVLISHDHLRVELQVQPPNRQPVTLMNGRMTYPTLADFRAPTCIYNLPPPHSTINNGWTVKFLRFAYPHKDFDASKLYPHTSVQLIFSVVGHARAFMEGPWSVQPSDLPFSPGSLAAYEPPYPKFPIRNDLKPPFAKE